MRLTNNDLGRWGEKRAVNYLQSQDYTILNKNYQINIGEIDIIAYKEGQLIFIEVKTRRSLNYGLPRTAVNFPKQDHIKRVAQYYLLEHSLPKMQLRFDVITIIVSENMENINHFKNAF